MLNLSRPPAQYDTDDQGRTRRAIEIEDKKNIKQDRPLTRMLFVSPNGTKYYLSVSNAGAAVWTAA